LRSEKYFSFLTSHFSIYNMRSVTIVIPVYNEALSIQENLKEILKYARETEDISARILVVNDGSADNTAELVYELSVSEKEIDILSLNRNFGKEAAIKAGLDHASGDAVIVMDSDLQHPPSAADDRALETGRRCRRMQ